jgi:hypothetical protein
MQPDKAATTGVKVNATPLYLAAAVLFSLFMMAFFACPLRSRHRPVTRVHTEQFTVPPQPAIQPAATRPYKPPPPAPPALPPQRIPSPCEVCAEPAERYIKAIQSPFPEHRQIYEAPRMFNNLQASALYSNHTIVPHTLRRSDGYLQSER